MSPAMDSPTSVLPPHGRACGRRGEWRWWSVLIVIALLAAMFAAVATIGARQAARGDRVLGVLEPVADALRVSGCDAGTWAVVHGSLVGWAVTGAAAVTALVGLAVEGRRAWPLLMLTGALSLGAWGQILLFAGRTAAGVWCYVGGLLCAAILGAVRPLCVLPGIPQLPALDGATAPPEEAGARGHWAWEAALVLALAFVGLIARVYALAELPYHFEREMIASMIMSRSVWSVGAYLGKFFLGVSAGIVHLLPGPLFFGVFGSSVYTIRLVSAFFGFVAIPLVYCLVRRLVGIGGAVVATVLLIAAPEQLYWSRIETGGFSPMALFALLTALLSLSMVRRFSPATVFAMALWMPVSRFFYVPCWVMLASPPLLYGHSIFFVRRAWRRAWYVVPLVVGGVVLWIVSLSVVQSVVNRAPWRFVHPAMLFGGPLWRRPDAPAFGADQLVELLRWHVAGMTKQLSRVVGGLWYGDGWMFSQWFTRTCVTPDHPTVLNPAVAVLFALGLGYLCGQIHRRRAWLLLVWVVLALLPAIMSEEPSTRRQALLLPAVPVVAAVFVAAAVALVRAGAGRWAARLTSGVLSVVVAAIAAVSLGSHYGIATGVSWIPHITPFARPLFASGDLIVHNLDQRIYSILLGNLDEFLAAPACVQELAGKSWLAAALAPPCPFEGTMYDLTIPPERRALLRRTYAPRHLSFLFDANTESQPFLDFLRGLYPAAETRTDRFVDILQREQTTVSLTVDWAAVRALRSPVLVAASPEDRPAGIETALLNGVTLAVASGDAGQGAAGTALVVRGGLIVERAGWYNFAVGGACPGAMLTVDGAAFPAADGWAMVDGVHEFELRIPSRADCAPPLDILTRGEESAPMGAVNPAMVVSPALASAASVRAPKATTYPGYGEARVVATWPGGHGLDLAADAEGGVVIVTLGPEGLLMRRFDRQGNEAAKWKPPVPPDREWYRLAADRAGFSYLLASTEVSVYDRSGRPVGVWPVPVGESPTDLAVTPDGHVLVALPARDSLAVFAREGVLKGEIRLLGDQVAPLSRPVSVAVEAGGAMAVVQSDGRARLFRWGVDPLKPEPLREFQMFRGGSLTGVARVDFDGPARLLVSDASRKAPMVFDAGGERLLAAAPARDLLSRSFGPIIGLRAAADGLYLLTEDRVWQVGR